MKIFSWTLKFLGYEIRIRCLPKTYLEEENAIRAMIATGWYGAASASIGKAYRHWGVEPELARLNSLCILLLRNYKKIL